MGWSGQISAYLWIIYYSLFYKQFGIGSVKYQERKRQPTPWNCTEINTYSSRGFPTTVLMEVARYGAQIGMGLLSKGTTSVHKRYKLNTKIKYWKCFAKGRIAMYISWSQFTHSNVILMDYFLYQSRKTKTSLSLLTLDPCCRDLKSCCKSITSTLSKDLLSSQHFVTLFFLKSWVL